MRRTLVPITFALALATGAVLADLRLFFVLDPVGADGASLGATANVATVRRFYDGVNQALSTGDTTLLTQFVTTDFVDDTVRPGVTADRSGLFRYLQTLHTTEPDLWLTVRDLVAQGDRVAARVQVEGASGTPPPGLPAVTGRAWGTVDVFRVRSDRIVEHWGDDTGFGFAVPLLVATVPVELPSAKMVEVGRQTYPPGATDRRWVWGPTGMIVEAGALSVAHDEKSTEAATVVRATGERLALPPGNVARLGAGDALILASGSLDEVRNTGATSAVAIALWSRPATIPRETNEAPADAIPVVVPRELRAVAPTPGATYEALAGGIPVVFPGDWATLAIGRIALAPGAATAKHKIANAEFAFVEAGSLALTVEDGAAWVGPGSGYSTRAATTAPLAAGAGITFDAGTMVSFAPAGNEPLIVLVVSIGPAVDGVPLSTALGS
jgi:predicted ester cyclase/quercetin dioxygenase-like cupin family protein